MLADNWKREQALKAYRQRKRCKKLLRQERVIKKNLYIQMEPFLPPDKNDEGSKNWIEKAIRGVWLYFTYML